MFGEELEKRTDGRIKVDVITGGALLNMREAIPGITKGIADMGVIVSQYEPGIFRAWVPFGSMRDLRTVISPRSILYLSWKMHKEFPEIEEGFTSANMKVLAFVPSPPLGLFTKKQIKLLSDLEGLKIRCASEALGEMMEAVGATKILTAGSEVYTGLATGVLDGSTTNFAYAVPEGWLEVATYANTMGSRFTSPLAATVMVMNLDAWKSLSPEDQELFLEVGHDVAVTWTDMVAQDEKDWVDQCREDPKITVTSLPDEEMDKWAKVQPDWFSRIAKDLDGAGLPGTAMTDRLLQLIIDLDTGEWNAAKEYWEAKY